MHLRNNEDYPINPPAELGRNYNFMLGTNTSDKLSSGQTFDKMHIEIMALQDKIKFLEAAMVTSPSVHGDTQQT